jgi:hypothetical protein
MSSTRSAYRLAYVRLSFQLKSVLTLISICASLSIRVAAQQPAAAPVPLVFDGVTVIDVQQGRRLPAQRVVIVGNRIRAMGSGRTVQMPAGARVVDAQGKYLIPGLWDLHVHPFHSTDVFYPLLIANGVTGMRDAGSPVPLDTLRLWRTEILAGTRVGPPRQLFSGQAIAGPLEGCKRGYMNNYETCVADEADARHLVDSLKAAGADMIKPRSVSRAMYFVIAAEARRIGIPFGGHAEEETAIEASDSGASIIDHRQFKMGTKGLGVFCWGARGTVEQCRPVAERFKQRGTWWVPTLIREVSEGFAPPAYAQRIFDRFTERARAFWGGSPLHGNWLRDSASSDTHHAAPGAMSIMHRVGLPILAGTDTWITQTDKVPPGFSLHAELAMYVAEGLTPLEALQTATLNPAKFLRATDSLGTVATGKLADLVLLDADPLADITNTTTVRAVVANGRYYDRAALDSLLTDAR